MLETKEQRRERQNEAYKALLDFPMPSYRPVQTLSNAEYASKMKPFSTFDLIKDRVNREAQEDGFEGVVMFLWKTYPIRLW